MTNKNSTYRRLGDYIREVDVRNTDECLTENDLYGVSVTKEFITTHANLIGVRFNNYKVVKHRQFTYISDTSRRGEKIALAYNSFSKDIIVSSIYTVFEITDHNALMPEYLMMWFRRPEFDRYARFHSHGSAREVFDWEEMCDVMLPVPSLEEQRSIVSRYKAIETRISNNKQTIAKLEEAAQALYRKMFVDDVDVENLPEGWRRGCLGEVCSKIGSGSTPKGGKDSYLSEGISLIRSMNVFDFYFEREDLAHITESQAKALDSVTVQEKDILLNITGASVGRCCMVPTDILPARVNQHVMIIRANEINYQIFLLYQINSERTKRNLLSASESGSTREALTKGEVEMQKILIPAESYIEKFSKIVDPLIKQTQLLNIDNLKMNKMLSLMA